MAAHPRQVNHIVILGLKLRCQKIIHLDIHVHVGWGGWKPCVLGHTLLCIVQYWSIITFRSDVLQVGYSALFLCYVFLILLL